MNSYSQKQIQNICISFKDLFRIVFVIFCLYLMGDAFWRWDGFRYHSTFVEFIPNVSLAFILWSIVALCATLVIWLVMNAIVCISRRILSGIRSEHFFMTTVFIIFLSGLVWGGKKNIFPDVKTTAEVKLLVLLCTVGVSVFLSFSFREKAGLWMDNISERITPLVWIFMVFILISLPVTSCQLFFKDHENDDVQQTHNFSSQSINQRPNIVLVTFDTLTARDMSVYGYERPTTPFISEWARNATVFANLQAEGNWTPPAITSLMTGKRIWTHGLYQSNVNKQRVVESLPSELRRYGYYNMAIVQNQIAHPKRIGIEESFDIAPKYVHFIKPATLIGWSYGALDVLFYRFFGEKFELYNWMISQDFILGEILYRISGDLKKTPFPPDVAFNRFLHLIDQKPEKPFFAWIHIMPPHDHYLPPEPFMGMFEPSSELRVYTGNMITAIKADKFQRENAAILRARYDEFVRYCDKQFEEFIKSLEDRQLKNTIIILSSDHGESFEHDYYMHGGPHLYEQVTHIPLIVKEPGQTEGKIIKGLAEQIDIPATIFDLSGIPIPSWMEGRSLVPLMNEDGLQPRPAFAMNLDSNAYDEKITKGTIAVWEGKYKLIHYLEKNKYLLFNLKEDPDELNNLFEKQPDISSRLKELIQENLKMANDTIIRKKQ